MVGGSDGGDPPARSCLARRSGEPPAPVVLPPRRAAVVTAGAAQPVRHAFGPLGAQPVRGLRATRRPQCGDPLGVAATSGAASAPRKG
eukprot:11956296-Alexandrium_andersonii.AAC.1